MSGKEGNTLGKSLPKYFRYSALASAISLSIGIVHVQAATIYIDDGCNLEQAIKSANNDATGQNTGTCNAGNGADILIIPSNILYIITSGGYLGDWGNYVYTDNGFPAISSKITIRGNPQNRTSISTLGRDDFRIFFVEANGDLTLENFNISGGIASGPTNGTTRGGAILNFGSLTINDSTISGSTASTTGGAIYGGIRSITTLNNSEISGNNAGQKGGGVYARLGTVTLNNSIISGNTASDAGGGLFNQASKVSIDRSTISDNSAELGGGIFTYGIVNPGRFDLNDSTVSGNSAYLGGGIYAHNGRAYIDNSTISDNSADRYGGGITSKTTTMTLSNSTISNNWSIQAGGIFARGSGTVTLMNTTVSANTATVFGGGIFSRPGLNSGNTPTVSLFNSIIAGNSANNTREIGGDGTFLVNHSNLFGDDRNVKTRAMTQNVSPGISDITAFADGNKPTPLLSILRPLADNGGPTKTHFLPAGSPAVDAGNQTRCVNDGVTKDQRGIVRNAGNCDIGSFEQKRNTINVSGSCTLPNAIKAANRNEVIGSCLAGADVDTLVLEKKIYVLRSGVNQGDGDNNGLPSITSMINIQGNGATITRGGLNNFRLIHVATSGDLTLNQVTLSGGVASAASMGRYGGAIFNRGMLSLLNSTISGNSAETAGGGIHSAEGVVNIDSSTLNRNTADSQGGGLYLKSTNFNISNSTVSGNSGNFGGGIAVGFGSTGRIASSTLFGNSATGSLGGGVFTFGTATFSNSIVAGNRGASGGHEVSGLTGTISSDGTNLLGEKSQSSADAFNNFPFASSDVIASNDGNLPTDLSSILQPLANNGGPTQTHALLASSPAIDSGDQALCLNDGIKKDQRGRNRSDGACDIGAFERTDEGGSCYIIKIPAGKTVVFCL